MKLTAIIQMQEARQDLKYGAGVLPFHPGTRRFLLQKRSERVHNPLMWDYLGGGVDQGEDFREAAVREVEEEGGVDLDPDSLQYIGVFGEKPQEGLGGYHVFLHVAPEEYRCKPAQGEVAACAWLDLDDMRGKRMHPRVTKTFGDNEFRNYLRSLLHPGT